MQQPLVEPERAPDSPVALPEQIHDGTKPVTRFRYLRLILYLLRGALLTALTVVLFSNGVRIIRLNAHALSFFSQSFNEPRPFLLIGLWALTVLALSIFSFVSLVNIARLLLQVRHCPGSAQRKTA
ncbi:MAG TPA: hypothetical protein VF458_17590 [Ktedonobacteraceae bacterium]